MSFIHSIRFKLFIIISSVCLLLLILTGSFTISHVIERDKQLNIQHIKDLTNSKLQNITKVILLDDYEAATDLVSSLQSYPDIEQVYVYDNNGAGVMRYLNPKVNDLQTPDRKNLSPSNFSQNSFYVYQPIVFQGTHFGSIYIQHSTAKIEALAEELMFDLAYLVLVILAIAIIAAIIAQHFISKPIIKLKDKLTATTQTNDFGKPILHNQSNELGQLYDSVNLLLKTITEKEAKLLEVNHDLENQVALRSKELEEVYNQLAESEKMASLASLVSGVAHELNTPLGIAVTSHSLILQSIYNIHQGIKEKSLTQKHLLSSTEQVEKALNQADKAIHKVVNIVASFKEIAADHISDSVRELNLCDYIDEVMLSFSLVSESRKIDYEVNGDSDLLIETYPSAIAQVINNLVQNSLDHGFARDQSGKIVITISTSTNGNVLMSFQDDGVGIEKHQLNKVFEPFFTTGRQQGNIGLGLNIAYSIVSKKLNGRIIVDSKPGEFSRFIVEFAKSVND